MRSKYLVTILILLALAVPASPAYAGGVVSICDEAHLLTALAGGGTVTFSCSGTIILTAEIVIAADTTIDGSGQDVTISGNHAVRVFNVAFQVTLNLNRLTVANGNSGGGYGGGINSSGTVIVSNSTFSGNSATGYGGGIYSFGTMEVSNSTFSGNSAFYGGGIVNYYGYGIVSNSIFSGNNATYGGVIANAGNAATLTVSNSTFSSNSAYYGGGIDNDSGTLTVNNSTFSGNSTVYHGGGIANYNGTLTVSNCTIASNSAAGNGGGIFNSAGTLTVSNSTFSGNSAASGGGIYKDGQTVTLQNTIVANSPTGNNCYGTITDGGGNLSYPDTTCPGINSDPLLGPLQNNGGPTHTMALGSGSAALDAANDAICAAAPVNSLDQRGVARPQGPHCDIGAVEQIQEPAAVNLSGLSAQSLPGAIPPTIIVGLLLATLVSAGIRRRRHMT